MAGSVRAQLMLQPEQDRAPWWEGLGCAALQPDLPAASACPAPAARSLRQGSSAAPLPPAPALRCRHGKPMLCHKLLGLSPVPGWRDRQHPWLSPPSYHLQELQDACPHCPNLTPGRRGWGCDLRLLRLNCCMLRCCRARWGSCSSRSSGAWLRAVPIPAAARRCCRLQHPSGSSEPGQAVMLACPCSLPMIRG